MVDDLMACIWLGKAWNSLNNQETNTISRCFQKAGFFLPCNKQFDDFHPPLDTGCTLDDEEGVLLAEEELMADPPLLDNPEKWLDQLVESVGTTMSKRRLTMLMKKLGILNWKL